MSNDFPKLGINTTELVEAIENLLIQAQHHADELGAINWGRLRVVDVEYRLSMLTPDDGPHCIVMIEEASPDSRLPTWLNERIDRERFPRTYCECEW